MFVDVGGNIGSFMWQFAHKCSKVIIFEPIPRLNQVIEDSITFNRATNIELIKKALGDHLSTVRMLDNNNSSVVNEYDDSRTLNVEISTLDRELKHLNSIDFIKIDVEGFELKVLRGGAEIIRKHKPVLLVELHLGFIENYGESYKDVIDWIESLNYSIRYFSFLDELRLPKYQRILNRWAGNKGVQLINKNGFVEDLAVNPRLSSYHLLCEPQ